MIVTMKTPPLSLSITPSWIAALHIDDSSRYYPVPITLPGSSPHLAGQSNLNFLPEIPTRPAPVKLQATSDVNFLSTISRLSSDS